MTVQYDKLIDIERLGAFKGMCDDEYAAGTHTHSYAGAPTSGGNADRSNAILFGSVDATSTATAFTATVAGLDALADGTAVYLRNHVVTSAAGFTVDVNGFGAKKCYNNMTNATQDTTIFNIAYSMLFIYDSSLDEGNGGWWIYRGYDGNTNTIGYQVRTNSGRKPAADKGYRYRIWLTSADGASWVPINTSTATDATTARTLNTRKIDPFGPIAYNSTNGTCNAAANLPAATMWRVYTLTIGYSYVKTLTVWDPVYLKCTPQADGSAVMNDIVQALPASKDGYIYIHLGTAYSATSMELQTEHPVYWHDGTGIRIWTGAEPSSGGGTKTTWYGTCSTSGTAAKVVTCDGFALEAGAMISVLFSQENSYGQPTLNVNGTGAKSVYVGHSDTYGDANPLKWMARTLITFVYDGTQYRYIAASASASVNPPRGAGTWYGTCSTAATTATKTSQLNNFVPTRGALVLIHATTANTYTAGALKLNINSTGDKAIYKDNAATSSTNTLTWAADDDLMFMYDGSEYRYCFGSSTESGGSSVEPATANPVMDGTAAVGSSDKYAREDHVHPTDTSRVAEQTIDTVKGKTATITNSNGTISITAVQGASAVAVQGITINGLVTPSSNYMPTTKLYVDTSRQETLVSGTNIKTINNESLLGSGNISVGGATYSTVAVQIATSAWSGTTATVNVTGVTTSNDVIVAPAPASTTAWAAAGIYCSAQGAGTLTFTCSTAPSETVTANVMVFDGGTAIYNLTKNNQMKTGTWNGSSFTETGQVEYAAGASVYVRFSTLLGYSSISTTPQTTVTTVADVGSYRIVTFTMPDADTTLAWVSPYTISRATTKLNVDKATAMPGETVTITNPQSTPMSSIVYKTDDRDTIVLAGATMAAGTTRTFTMPAFNVTVANTTK